jgi:hypothetical protein
MFGYDIESSVEALWKRSEGNHSVALAASIRRYVPRTLGANRSQPLRSGWLATRAATSDEVRELRRESRALKEVVAELTLENRLLKNSMIADGECED